MMCVEGNGIYRIYFFYIIFFDSMIFECIFFFCIFGFGLRYFIVIFFKKNYKNFVIYLKIYIVFKFFIRVLKFDKLGIVIVYEIF